MTPEVQTPQVETTRNDNRPFVYHNIIPKLGPAFKDDKWPSLLGANGGRIGITYYQCPVALQRGAQDAGWGPTQDLKLYTITGPKGSVDCVLLCRGQVLVGSDPLANKRECKIHPDIPRLTGLDPQCGLVHNPRLEAETAPETKKASKEKKS